MFSVGIVDHDSQLDLVFLLHTRHPHWPVQRLLACGGKRDALLARKPMSRLPPPHPRLALPFPMPTYKPPSRSCQNSPKTPRLPCNVKSDPTPLRYGVTSASGMILLLPAGPSTGLGLTQPAPGD